MDVLRYGRPDMTPGLSSGLLKDVVESEGAGLVGDHAAGATVLEVSSGGFREAGSCQVAGVTYAYTRDGDSLTIDPALAAAAEDGDPVLSLAPDGSVETAKVAVVDVDQDGDPENDIWADIPGELASFYAFGSDAAGAIVKVRDTPYGYEVASRPMDGPKIDPDYVATPFFRAYLGANKTIPHDTDTILDGWVATDNTGFINPSPGRRTIYREGLYLIAGGLRWAATPTNRKASGPSVLRAATGVTETLWRDGRPNTGAARESTAFAVPIRLYPGDQVYVVAWQNSTANLDVLGAAGADLDLTFFSITWQGY